LIGSAPSTTPSAKKHSEAGSELKGQVVPMIGVPQGLTTWTPQTRATEQKCIPPYYYNDGKIQGFRASHWMNGSCVQDYGTMTLMPQVGKVEINPEKRAEAYSRKTEIVRPDLYQVDLQNSGIKVAMTALCRSGFFKIKYPNQQENYLIVEPNSDEGVGFVQVFPEKRNSRL
jgi:putative alpha-1,2-mannosidase